MSKVILLLITLVSIGCIATFRVGDPVAPQSSLDPSVIPADIGLDVLIERKGSSTVPWRDFAFEAYKDSGVFSLVSDTLRSGEWQARVRIVESEREGGGSFALTLLTGFIFPSRSRTTIKVITTIVQPDGTRLPQITREDAYDDWMGWPVLPVAFSNMSADVEEEIIEDLTRASLLDAIERGYFASASGGGTSIASRDTDGASHAAANRPVVELTSPSGTRVTDDFVTVVLTARTASGVADVSLSVNGDPVRTSSAPERTRSLEFSTTEKVPIMLGQNILHVAVTDQAGRVGSSSLQIDRIEATAESLGRTGRRATYGAFYKRRIAAVIGIDAYRHWPSLEGASGDGRRMAAKLRGLGFDEVIELYDGAATRAGILRLLGDELPRKTTQEDLAFIYFAGHGQTETLANGEKRGYLIPEDGTAEGVFGTGISMATLRDLSNRLPAKHVYYAMDSCYSGLGFARGISATPKTQGYLEKITSRRAVQMITAGMEGEEAIERGAGGLFTTYLIRALDGEADVDQDGVVTAGEIGNYVRPGVSLASQQRQTPLYGTLDGNGEVAIVLSGAR